MRQQSIHRNTTWSSYCECSHVLKQRLENIPELDSLAFFFFTTFTKEVTFWDFSNSFVTALFPITSTEWGTLSRNGIGLVEFLRIHEFKSNLNIGNVIV